MSTFFKRELRSSRKGLIIWTAIIAGMGLMYTFLYLLLKPAMAELEAVIQSMGEMAEMMGESSSAFSNLRGYFATEIGTIHALGSCLFAVAMSANILSKEESHHTAEFVFTLPVSRKSVITAKFLSCVVNIAIFNIVCIVAYILAFAVLKDVSFIPEFLLFMLASFFMNLEMAAICWFLSSLGKKNKLGIGIGIGILLYVVEMIASSISKIKDFLFFTPYSYANSTEIFDGKANIPGIIFGAVVLVGMTIAAEMIYSKRDLSA